MSDITVVIPDPLITVVEVNVGLAGRSAYQEAVAGGFVGTSAEWLVSLGVGVTTVSQLVSFGIPTRIIGALDVAGDYDAETLAAIAAKQAAGWPDDLIWIQIGAVAGPLSASAAVAAFAIDSGIALAAPSVTAVVLSEGATIAAASAFLIAAGMALTAPTVTAREAAIATIAAFVVDSGVALIAPAVAGVVLAEGAVVAVVPAFLIDAGVALAPSVVTALEVAAASAPAFTVDSEVALSAPAVTGVEFAAGSAMATAAAFVVDAGVALIAPVVTGVEASSSTASAPAFGVDARAALTAPSVVGVENAGGGPETIYASTDDAWSTAGTQTSWVSARGATGANFTYSDILHVYAGGWLEEEEFEYFETSRGWIDFTIESSATPYDSVSLGLYATAVSGTSPVQVSVQLSSHAIPLVNGQVQQAFPGASNGDSLGQTAAITTLNQYYEINTPELKTAVNTIRTTGGGVLKLVLREYALDFQNAGTWATWNEVTLSSANHANQNQHPRLVVE